MTGSQLLLLWKNDLWAQRLKSFLFGPIRVKRGCYIHYLLYGKWGLLKRRVLCYFGQQIDNGPNPLEENNAGGNEERRM